MLSPGGTTDYLSSDGIAFLLCRGASRERWITLLPCRACQRAILLLTLVSTPPGYPCCTTVSTRPCFDHYPISSATLVSLWQPHLPIHPPRACISCSRPRRIWSIVTPNSALHLLASPRPAVTRSDWCVT